MARLFGFSIEDNEKTPAGVVSPIPPSNQDGSENFASSGFFGSYNLDIEGLYKNETDLIRRYRQMALYPECDSAIEDIVNEAIVSDTNDSPVKIELLIIFSNFLTLTKRHMRFSVTGILTEDSIITRSSTKRILKMVFKSSDILTHLKLDMSVS
jgi:hypothetical protein